MSAILPFLQDLLAHRMTEVRDWLEAEFATTPALFYSSVDLRHSGLKLAPVDTNLFPAGFNNIDPDGHLYAASVLKTMLHERLPGAKKLLLLPENHTRNQGYIDHLCHLIRIIEEAGLEVQLGRLLPEQYGSDDSDDVIELTTSKGRLLQSEPIARAGDTISTKAGYVPDVVVVNNDLTAGAPKILCGLEQAVMPPTGVGWYRRRKSVYFDAYDKIAGAFAATFDFDPWLISTYSHQCGTINFKERTGLECVAINVEKVLHRLRQKYERYGITEEPYVFIKANSGTYGMGIMTVRSGEEVYEMNKKARNKMNVIKEGTANSDVIIQEGVPTLDAREGATAEPVIYLLGGKAIGGFWRVNQARDAYINLNATGMHFETMREDFAQCFSPTSDASAVSVYALISELATLAASREDYPTPAPCDEA
jgi:glutamate--cysteine ligase